MGSLRTLGPTPQDTRSGTEAQRRTGLAPGSTLCHYGSLGLPLTSWVTLGKERVILILIDRMEITVPFLMNTWTGPGAGRPV